MITQEQVVAALGDMSLMELIKLTRDLEQLWNVEAKPQMVAYNPLPQVETQTTVQVSFNVILQSVPPEKKISVIKTVRELLGLTLLDSKTLLESLPKTVKEDQSKEEADELQRKLMQAGAVVEVK
jgi:large subunit ribosomal protein L7/L12